MSNVEVLGRIGPEGPSLFVLYTGGTFGMGADASGSLVPLDLRDIRDHLPFLRRLPLALTVATFVHPIDSSSMRPSDWIDIADAIVDQAPGHAGVVVLHGTDTMAYTASALSFLLEGIDIPIVLTGAQRSVTELRSDGRENLVTALAIAAGHLRGDVLVPEVTVFFADLLLRGNRSVKVHADSYHGFASPNLPPLATAGVSIEFASNVIRAPSAGPIRRNGGMSSDVTGMRLHPGIDGYDLEAALARPGLRGFVLEAYGAGNGPTAQWFLNHVQSAAERGVAVVVTTQCRAGSVVGGRYASGSALLAAGAVPGGDMTFEAALTKLMVLTDRHGVGDVRRLMQQDLAGELSV
ncbi:MAG TPA: asparaginase [Ornithinibacter sp.]|nr:asparaginase [Ornithinibacter sp.]